MARRKPPRPGPTPRVTRTPWMIAALVAGVLALYWGSLGNPLVFDDGQIPARILGSYLTSGLEFELRWVSSITFGWTHEAFGKDWFWHRLENVLLHAAVVSVLFLFLRRLFSIVLHSDDADSAWYAFSSALLFLAHPVAVYGVAYLIQRSILMATLFGLVTLWLFLEGLVRNGRWWFVASAVAYFAAVFSKEHSVMVPAVAAALAVLVRGWPPRLLRELALPFALYAAIAALVTLKARGLLGAQYEPFAEAAVRQLVEADRTGERPSLYALSVINQGYLFFRYLLTWLLPFPGWMSADLRPAFPAHLASWPQAAGFLVWLIWPAVAVALLVRRGRAGIVGFAMLAPWTLALTEMATVRVQEPFVLYRSYLWMSLLPAAVPALMAGLGPRWRYALLVAACLALLPPFFDRLRTFSSDLRLWDDAVRKIGDSRVPYADRSYRNRGVAYYYLGRYREALQDFDKALELDPRNAKSWLMRGSLHMRAEESERALADFNRALEIDPSYANALERRCVVLMRLRRLDQALADCTHAYELNPGEIDNSISLGMVRALRRETAQAEHHYRRAIEIDPASAVARYQYGVLLRGLRRNAEAREQFSAACWARMQSACKAADELGAAN